MRTVLLLLIACAGLSAQVTIAPTATITKADADALIWWVGHNFQPEADKDSNERVSPVEARDWIYMKFGEMLDTFVERAHRQRREEEKAALPADHQAAIDAYEAAKAALETFERRKKSINP